MTRGPILKICHGPGPLSYNTVWGSAGGRWKCLVWDLNNTQADTSIKDCLLKFEKKKLRPFFFFFFAVTIMHHAEIK